MLRTLVTVTSPALILSCGDEDMKQYAKTSTSSAASCRPDPGSTYLAIGQDLFSIAEYLREQYNASLHEFAAAAAAKNLKNKSVVSSVPGAKHTRRTPPATTLPESFSSFSLARPAVYMVYTDIQELRGLSEPVDYGSGIEYADGLLQLPLMTAGTTTTTAQPASFALQIGLWLNGTAGCTDLLSGVLDEQVASLYRYLMEHCSATKIFLRVGYEFDNPYFGYGSDPTTFQRAFRFLFDACDQQYSRAQCQDKIAFCWHSWAAGTPGNTTLADFYPGDKYVDWIGVSIFSQLYADPVWNGLGNRETVQAVLDFAVARGNKPVMIAESTPYGGIDRLPDPWKDWFEPVLELIADNDIAMWSYINSDWESQPMWHGVGFGDSRLSTNATVMRLWRQHVLGEPRFAAAVGQQQQLTCKHDGSGQHGHDHWHFPSRRNGSLQMAPRDSLWSIGPFHDIAHYGSDEQPPQPPPSNPSEVYWLGAGVIVVAVILCLFRDTLLLYCHRNDDYEVVLDEDDEDVSSHFLEPNRTGYGTLE